MSKYILISESALDAALVSEGFSKDSLEPAEGCEVYSFEMAGSIKAFRVASEQPAPCFALIGREHLEYLALEGGDINEIYRRIARVVKGLSSPPVHLPRQWAEYHYRNLLAFFALPRDTSNVRWVVDFSSNRCARFDFLSSSQAEVDLSNFEPTEWPIELGDVISALLSEKISPRDSKSPSALAHEVDLLTIGSASVVNNLTYEEWAAKLTNKQSEILATPIDKSIRILGPAGSGKTLALCMRALQVSRSDEVVAQGKRVLIATHSWAMSERIDGVLTTLNSSVPPNSVTVFPLLSLLEYHAGHIGQRKTEVIGDDSTTGRLRCLDIIGQIVFKISAEKHAGVSLWISAALAADAESRNKVDLVINLYDEISGVLSASGVAPDDPEAIQNYLTASREDWMPPFTTVLDRGFVIAVYQQFLQNLVDRAAITTDQFILDSIRVLETFTWRMRKETEGYDIIFVDELQLFDPQERSALELLGRQRTGVPFVTAEDPSQGVFSALHGKRANVEDTPVYLDTVHRFNKEIFEFINFVYQRFPLNALPLKIEEASKSGPSRPSLEIFEDDEIAIYKASEQVKTLYDGSKSGDRICIVSLGDVDGAITDRLTSLKLQVTRLESFDDVEQLAYRKRSIVVSPWQFIGGTQFSHVLVLACGISEPNSQFGRLREMVAVYLSCSRAAESLTVFCSGYVPSVLWEAGEHGFLSRKDESRRSPARPMITRSK